MKKRKNFTCMTLLMLIFSLLSGCTPDSANNSGTTTLPTESIQQIHETADDSPDSDAPDDSGTADSSATEIAETSPAASVPSDSTGLTVRFLDVGQADSALLACDGHYMLIDGGNRDDSSLLYTVLKNANITHLDLVIGTHSDEDHIGGLAGALNFADADTTLCAVTDHDSKAFTNFKKYADENGGGIQVPSVGDGYQLGSADVDIIAVNSGSETNDTSIVTRVTYGQTTFLFTGDAEEETEQFLLNSSEDLTSTVLKVSHHGSSGASSSKFLEAVMPEYSVISVGSGNSYGHPSQKTLDRLTAVDTKILRTDLLGEIVFYSDGTSVSYVSEKNSSADPTLNQSETISNDTVNSSDSIVSSSEQSYVLNTNSMKFHAPSCSSVSKMSEKNRRDYTGTRDELLSMGYDPCGSCNP